MNVLNCNSQRFVSRFIHALYNALTNWGQSKNTVVLMSAFGRKRTLAYLKSSNYQGSAKDPKWTFANLTLRRFILLEYSLCNLRINYRNPLASNIIEKMNWSHRLAIIREEFD